VPRHIPAVVGEDSTQNLAEPGAADVLRPAVDATPAADESSAIGIARHVETVVAAA